MDKNPNKTKKTKNVNPLAIKKEKNERQSTFRRDEELFLVRLVLARPIIENKCTDATTTQTKNAAWADLTNEFNAANLNVVCVYDCDLVCSGFSFIYSFFLHFSWQSHANKNRCSQNIKI